MFKIVLLRYIDIHIIWTYLIYAIMDLTICIQPCRHHQNQIVNIFVTSKILWSLCFCFVKKRQEIYYYHNKFYHELLTIGTMLYNRYLELSHLEYCNFVYIEQQLSTSLLPSPWRPSLYSASVSLTILEAWCRCNHATFVFL